MQPEKRSERKVLTPWRTVKLPQPKVQGRKESQGYEEDRTWIIQILVPL